MSLFSSRLVAQDRPPIEVEFTGMFWLTTTYNFQSSDPNWSEMLRPSKLLNDQGRPFADDGQFTIGIRPSRFGFNTRQETKKGDLVTRFAFDLVGGGSNIGQTFFRVHSAYLEWNRWAFGQRNSVFMDGSVNPTTVDFFGPSGLVLLRNIQVSYQVVDRQATQVMVGLENPSATSDLSPFRGDFEYADKLSDIVFTNKLPAATIHYRRSFAKGHFQLGWVTKYISWFDRSGTPQEDYSGSTWGYGANLTGRLVASSHVTLKGAFVTGKGIQNFLNDGTADVGVRTDPDNTVTPYTGGAIPFYSIMAASEVKLSETLSATVVFSRVVNQTFASQLSTSFERGNYFTLGLIHQPFSNISFGVEYQHASRQNTDFAGDPVLGLPAAQGRFFAVHKLQANFIYRFAKKL
ncbi:DcaP family trimeric outer membrane transporter [Penaeicola halotolerans]|uniref:DcaP family trimeric outer membrane transporter n=1 Tax=Penaeicola halotolerans TaxID=2793196 RepID=UPI001CF843A3|nr:DcaP family trimeric outer membrane transporter [Penaeicola halotolerans]